MLDAPLARLEQSRDELAKAWLLRVLERAPLSDIERIPTERIVRELPDLISDIVRAVARSAAGSPGDVLSEGVRVRAPSRELALDEDPQQEPFPPAVQRGGDPGYFREIEAEKERGIAHHDLIARTAAAGSPDFSNARMAAIPENRSRWGASSA